MAAGDRWGGAPARRAPSAGRGERAWLWVLAAVGAVGVNGAFLCGMVREDLVREAAGNPIALAFAGEALLVTAALAWLLRDWGVSRMAPAAFVGLALLGSLAFALPVALLWSRREARVPGRGRAARRRAGASGTRRVPPPCSPAPGGHNCDDIGSGPVHTRC